MRADDQDAIHWHIHVPFESSCNVNFVEKSNLPEESEFLFVLYSVFSVLKVEWTGGTTASPHIIHLIASHDNKREPEDLPNAPWA